MHATIFFFKFVTINNIVLFCFSIHFIHFILSLDIDVFQSYKHYYIETIDYFVRIKNRKFEKFEFLIAYQKFRDQIFKLSIIRHAFKTTNIIFFNSNIMLNILRQKINNNTHKFRIFNFQSQLIKRISKNSELIKKFEEKIKRALKHESSDKNIIIMIKKNVDCFQRYERNTMIIVNTLNFIIKNFIMIQQVFMKRKIRAKLNWHNCIKKKIMKINQCRKLCFIRQKKKKWSERRNKKRIKLIKHREFYSMILRQSHIWLIKKKFQMSLFFNFFIANSCYLIEYLWRNDFLKMKKKNMKKSKWKRANVNHSMRIYSIIFWMMYFFDQIISYLFYTEYFLFNWIIVKWWFFECIKVKSWKKRLWGDTVFEVMSTKGKPPHSESGLVRLGHMYMYVRSNKGYESKYAVAISAVLPWEDSLHFAFSFKSPEIGILLIHKTFFEVGGGMVFRIWTYKICSSHFTEFN